MISWDCSCPTSEERSEAGYGMSYTDAAFSFWWTLCKNNDEVFAADVDVRWISSAFGLQTANTARNILGSYCRFDASNVLDDLSEPKETSPRQGHLLVKRLLMQNARRYACSRLFPVASTFTETGVPAVEGQRRDA